MGADPDLDRSAESPRPVAVILPRLDVDQAGQKGLAVLALALVQQLVGVARALAVHQHVLQLLQALQVHLELGVAKAQALAHVAAREAVLGPRQLLRAAVVGHESVEGHEQTPGLRRQLVQRPAQHLVRQAVGHGDVVQRHVHVGHQHARCSTLCTGRWYWCSSAMVRISVRYLTWSRRVRVRSSRKVRWRA